MKNQKKRVNNTISGEKKEIINRVIMYKKVVRIGLIENKGSGKTSIMEEISKRLK